MSDRATLDPVMVRSQEIGRFSRGQLQRDDNFDFAALVDRKQIAVVGPARTLMGTRKGNWIDTHDVVVRFNDAFAFTAGAASLSVDLGTRTDILYCNQVVLRKEILEGTSARNRFAAFARDSNLKYVICTNNSLSYGPDGRPSPHCDRKDRDVPELFTRFLSEEAPGTRFRVVHSASERIIKWMGGHWGRTGFVALVDLLAYQPLGLSVTGMTFYHGGGHLATKGPELWPQGNRDGRTSISPSGFGHDSAIELVLFRDLMLAFGPRISIDAPLQTLVASIERGNP